MSFYVNDQEKYLVYAEKWDEMSFDKYRVNFSWNEITDDTVIVNKNGLPLHIGYELEINGATNEADYLDGSFVDEKDGSVHRMVTGNSSTVPYVLVGAGETVSMRVRAVYYHSNASSTMRIIRDRAYIRRKICCMLPICTMNGQRKIMLNCRQTERSHTITLPWK